MADRAVSIKTRSYPLLPIPDNLINADRLTQLIVLVDLFLYFYFYIFQPLSLLPLARALTYRAPILALMPDSHIT